MRNTLIDVNTTIEKVKSTLLSMQRASWSPGRATEGQAFFLLMEASYQDYQKS
jgi:hypothetical protein